MAIYHLSVKAISRSAGRSATAAAAYRAGVEIIDARTGEIHDYTRKGGVQSADLVLPAAAPEWAADRSALWNAAEAAEKRKDACVAREYEVALPSELDAGQRRRLALAFAQELADRNGCAVDVAIHAPGREGDQRNHHAHILTTTRQLGPEGLGAKCDIEKAGRNRRADLEAVRARWAELANAALREHGHAVSVDHRSLKAQGIERDPTTHLGPAVTALERRGARTEVSWRIQEQANERLARAAELGALERADREGFRSFVDTKTELNAALAERDRRRRQPQLRDELAQQVATMSEGRAVIVERELARYSGPVFALNEGHAAVHIGRGEVKLIDRQQHQVELGAGTMDGGKWTQRALDRNMLSPLRAALGPGATQQLDQAQARGVDFGMAEGVNRGDGRERT